MRTKTAMLSLLTVLITIVGTAHPQQRRDQPTKDWAQYNYDNRGWRYNAGESRISPDNADKLEVKWQFPRKGAKERVGIIHATPSVVDGFVYFGTCSSANDPIPPAFYKLSPQGKLVWKYTVKSVIIKENKDPYAIHGFKATDSILNASLVTATHVFFGTFGGQIICLDRFTGDEVWKINTKKAPFPGAHHSNTVMSSPIMADGKLIVPGGGFEHSLGAVKEYECCSGRGYVAAFVPETGELLWKYDVGPKPKKLNPPVELDDGKGGKVTFKYGPSTSSVWSTPSYDPETKMLFFGTDTHNAPRQPTKKNARLYNKYSSAIIAISVDDGSEKWVRQLVRNDVWNNALPSWDPKTGQYKDVTIGDTPKLYAINGGHTKIVGVGCKNGSFYVLDRQSGQILESTPTYGGRPDPDFVASDPHARVLALPSTIGGLQTGCAFDGRRVYANAIDWLGSVDSRVRQYAQHPPSGGRVTALRPDTKAEFWRHERPKTKIPRADDPKRILDSGDPVGSGIAVANGVAFFTTTISGKLVVLDVNDGKCLKEIELGPVWCGPSVSRGRVYVGTGNFLFEPWSDEEAESEDEYVFNFPLRSSGTLYCFGLPGADEVDGLPNSETK